MNIENIDSLSNTLDELLNTISDKFGDNSEEIITDIADKIKEKVSNTEDAFENKIDTDNFVENVFSSNSALDMTNSTLQIDGVSCSVEGAFDDFGNITGGFQEDTVANQFIEDVNGNINEQINDVDLESNDFSNDVEYGEQISSDNVNELDYSEISNDNFSANEVETENDKFLNEYDANNYNELTNSEFDNSIMNDDTLNNTDSFAEDQLSKGIDNEMTADTAVETLEEIAEIVL